MKYLVFEANGTDEFEMFTSDSLEECRKEWSKLTNINDREKNNSVAHIVEREAYEAGNYDFLEKWMYVAGKETGTFIKRVDSIEAGLDSIDYFEFKDKANGEYQENFYDIVDENHCSLLN